MVDRINIPEFAVSKFNQALKDIIESNFNYVKLKGEISEVKKATRSQIYLKL
jgi:Exonuclease VII, large subunit